MNTPRHTLRVIFALSSGACAVILMLFVRGRATPTTGFWVQLLATALVVSAAGCYLAFRRGGLLLQDVPLSRFLPKLLLHLAVAYLACSVLASAVAFAALYVVTRSPEGSAALAALAGLWLSLWVAPGIAAITSARALSSGT